MEKNVNMPLCSFCIKSGIFCQKCQKKIDSGQIGETDIKIAKLLIALEQRYPSLQKIRFHNAFEVDSVLAIVVGRGHLSAFFENNGKILREIAQETGKRVRVIEKHGEVRRFLEDLFAPVNITTINTIWLPGGTTETRVILAGRPRRLPLKTRVLKRLAKKIRGITLRIAYEEQLERMIR
jgi:transcription antitermination factor NusA-like protein